MKDAESHSDIKTLAQNDGPSYSIYKQGSTNSFYSSNNDQIYLYERPAIQVMKEKCSDANNLLFSPKENKETEYSFETCEWDKNPGFLNEDSLSTIMKKS